MADDSVVVMKSLPMKAGNGVEGKTRMTYGVFVRALLCQKPLELRRDEVYLKVLWKLKLAVN